jgi:hypothetical protein
LRMARLDAFNANAEAKPPDGKFAEVEQSMGRCKRDTGTLDGTLESSGNPSFDCPDCGAVFDKSTGWAQHSVEGCQ